MLKIIRFTALSLFALTISACSSFSLLDANQAQNKRLCAKDDGSFYTCQDNLPPQAAPKPQTNVFSPDLHFNMLSEYTEQMATELQQDVQTMQLDKPIVVASFVHLDASLQNTDALGNQLAESFINDLQQIGLPVSDHKLMGVLDVNDKGDFAFSRDMGQFYNELDIGYVLTGTMQKTSRGLIVNARIIDFKSNAVVASSSKFIPNLVIGQFL